MKENIKDINEEEENSTIESSSLKITTLSKSFKILIIFKILFILIKKQIMYKALRSKELDFFVVSATLKNKR